MCAFLFGKDKKDQGIKDKKQPKGPDKDYKAKNILSEKNKETTKIEEYSKSKMFSKEEIPSRQEVYSMIGKGIKIKGELIGDEDVVIEGFVEGKIKMEKSLNVGERGVVNADINAKVVRVSGKVEGNIYASDLIQLLPTSHVRGNLFSTKIIISEGANFQGKIDMSGNTQAEIHKGKSLPLQTESAKLKE